MAGKTEKTNLQRLHKTLSGLYEGRSRASLRFRMCLLFLDVAIVCSFIVVSFMGLPSGFYLADLLFAFIVLLDLVARWFIARDGRKFLFNPYNWADLVVVLSLVAPLFFGDFAFLRVIRALRVMRSHRVLQEMRKDITFFRRNEEVIQRSLNLLVFIFLISSFVYVVQAERNPDISTYTDALYFTVAALTTTGFGDIVLLGESGRWLSIAILVFGVGLFLRLLQSVFRPSKIKQKCSGCGLLLHDSDALHCKHCGREMKIETEGE
ncbi:MAG: ion transporter [Desulfonatronovibrio sp.]